MSLWYYYLETLQFNFRDCYHSNFPTENALYLIWILFLSCIEKYSIKTKEQFRLFFRSMHMTTAETEYNSVDKFILIL